jgi:hypothetical protein
LRPGRKRDEWYQRNNREQFAHELSLLTSLTQSPIWRSAVIEC